MYKLVAWGFVAFIFVFATAVGAGFDEVTLEGQVVCAKCSLHLEGLSDCQNALVVERDGDTRHYFLENNEINVEFGDVCMKKRQVLVTGNVTEHDGHTWIAATRIERVD